MMKQQMIEIYFKRKSPKAFKARGSPKAFKAMETGELEPEPIKQQKSMGARNSPLLGEPNQLGIPKLPSRDPRPVSEECGKTWSIEARKKALNALESGLQTQQ